MGKLINTSHYYEDSCIIAPNTDNDNRTGRGGSVGFSICVCSKSNWYHLRISYGRSIACLMVENLVHLIILKVKRWNTPIFGRTSLLYYSERTVSFTISEKWVAEFMS